MVYPWGYEKETTTTDVLVLDLQLLECSDKFLLFMPQCVVIICYISPREPSRADPFINALTLYLHARKPYSIHYLLTLFYFSSMLNMVNQGMQHILRYKERLVTLVPHLLFPDTSEPRVTWGLFLFLHTL